MKWTLIYFDDQIVNIECLSDLLADNFHVIGCHDATNFSQKLQDHHPHAILLDVHMPVIDGYSLYQKIALDPHYNGCPVLFISGDQSDKIKIKSYEEGGVDFLPRDINKEEIIVRLTSKIKFFLGRSTNLVLGNLEVDVVTMKAVINGKNIDLTLLELRMLNHIMRNYPQNFTRQQLIMKVWGNDNVKPGTINTHLTNLKQKIEAWDHQIKVRDENILVSKKEDL